MYGKNRLNEDIIVPRSKLPETFFGHTGDGNVHTNAMVKDSNDEKQIEAGNNALEEVFKTIIELGGTLSGEDGIGLSKASYMHLAFSDAEIKLMPDIKQAFDSNNLLNPFRRGIDKDVSN